MLLILSLMWLENKILEIKIKTFFIPQSPGKVQSINTYKLCNSFCIGSQLEDTLPCLTYDINNHPFFILINHNKIMKMGEKEIKAKFIVTFYLQKIK